MAKRTETRVTRRRAGDDDQRDDERDDARERTDDTPEDPGEGDQFEALAEFFEKFGGKGNKIVAERFNEQSGDWVNVDRYNFDGFDPFVLRKYAIYPTTRFRLTLRDSAYRYIKGGRYEISFAKPPEDAQPAAPAAAEKREDKTLELLMQTLRDDKAQLTELLKAQMGRPSEKPSVDPIELLMKAKDLLGLGGAGAARGESPFKSLKEAMEFMTFMREAMPEREEKSETVLGQIGEAVKIWRDMQTGAAARGGRALPPPKPAPGSPAAPAPAPAGGVAASHVVTNPPNTQEEQPVSTNPILDALNGYVPVFVSWAARGQDVDVAADFLVAELEESLVPLVVANYKPGGLTLSDSVVWDQILARAANPKEIDNVLAFVPQLAPYRPWVEAVVKRAVEIATQDDTAGAS